MSRGIEKFAPTPKGNVAVQNSHARALRIDEGHHRQSPHATTLILDTDMGNDIDDALALAMIHSLASRGECRLLGVAVSKDNLFAAPYVDVVNTFYGRGDVPIGVVRDGVTPNDRTFVRQIVSAREGERARYRRTQETGQFPDAVPLLRQLLSGQPDHSVVLVMIGFSTNMSRLLESPPDATNPLNGHELVERKVASVFAMAGDYSDEVQDNPTLANREYNIHCDIPSAQRFFSACPCPVTFCGYEVGMSLMFPASSISEDYHWAAKHPVVDAYRLYRKMPYDRPAWDPATVLAAVRPQAGYFALSPPGRVEIDDRGIALFRENAQGPHRVLQLREDQQQRVLSEILALCSQPVVSKPAAITSGRK